MRKIVCALLALACLLCMCGCSMNKKESSANFYYVRDAYIYGQEDGVIASEVRSTAEFTNAEEILRAYLNGPEDISLVSPFPRGARIVDLQYKGETLYITLSTHIVALSKARQVLACACFARTAMELTGVKAVHFQSDETGFTRMDPVLLDWNSVLLYDDYNVPTPTEP